MRFVCTEDSEKDTGLFIEVNLFFITLDVRLMTVSVRKGKELKEYDLLY